MAKDIKSDLTTAGNEFDDKLSETLTEAGNTFDAGGGRGLEAAAVGAASGLTAGLSDIYLTKDMFGEGAHYTPEELSQLVEQNKGVALTGEAAALISPLGFGGLLAGAGKAAAKVAGSQLTKALGKGVSKSLKDKIVEKIITNSAAGAVESGLYGIKETITEDALGEADANAENLLANMGVGAVLGGGLGVALGVGSALGSKLRGIPRAAHELEANPLTSKIERDFVGMNVPAEDVEKLRAVANRLDVQLTPGMESGSEIVRRFESHLAERPNLFGNNVRKTIENTKAGLQRNMGEVLTEAADKTRYEIGEAIQAKLLQRIDEEISPINELYGKVKKEVPTIALEPGQVGRTVSRLEKNSGEVIGGVVSKYKAEVAGYLKNQSTAEQLRGLISQVKSDARQAQRSGNFELARAANEAAVSLDRLFDRTVLKSALSSPKAGAVRTDLKLANKQYKKFMEFVSAFSEEAKLGKARSAGELREKIQKLSPEQLASKLFQKNNIKATRFMKENFPGIFEDVRTLRIAELKNAATKFDPIAGEYVQIKKFAAELDKMPPEIKELVFTPKQLQNIADVVYLDSKIPLPINPSGTSINLSYQNLFGLPGVLTDAAKYAVYKSLEVGAVRNTVKAIDKSNTNIRSVINSAADAVVTGGRTIRLREITNAALVKTSLLTNKKEDSASLEQSVANRMKEVAAISADPSIIADKVAGLGFHAPRAQAEAANTLMRAVNYLSVHAPISPMRVSPIAFREWTPSHIEATRYSRIMGAVFEPLTTIARLETGAFTLEEVDALKSVYPVLHANLVATISSKVMDSGKKPSYTALVRLSQLTGKPLIEEMHGSTIGELQQSWVPPQPAPSMMPAGTSQRSVSMKGQVNSLQSNLESVATRRRS